VRTDKSSDASSRGCTSDDAREEVGIEERFADTEVIVAESGTARETKGGCAKVDVGTFEEPALFVHREFR
jgi:hypothetical protein